MNHDIPNTNSHHHDPLEFPEGFLWGAATSAHQVEGGNRNNDWWPFEQRGKIDDGSTSAISCDHYHRFRKDFSLAKSLGHNTHRLSVEWSRIEPEEGSWDEAEIAHYIDVLKDLKAKGFVVMLTLHHFTNPLWFAELGGWEKRRNMRYFLRYAEICAKHFGPYVDFWITINEPNVYLSEGYLLAIWPPERRSLWKAAKVFRNLTYAHRQAYRVIHRTLEGQCGRSAWMPPKWEDDEHKCRVRVGLANNVSSFYAYRKHSLTDHFFVQCYDFLTNHLFYAFTRRQHDFLGINYYFHTRVRGVPSIRKLFPNFVNAADEKRDRSDIGWEIYPHGIFEVLVDLYEYYKLPIYITENGIATTNDDRRARFIVGYLKEIYHAIQSGVDVRGYFYWSLLDNFEWSKGLSVRFGLIEVDYTTLERRVRGSAHVLEHIARSNAIHHHLLHFLGHGVRLDEVLPGPSEAASV